MPGKKSGTSGIISIVIMAGVGVKVNVVGVSVASTIVVASFVTVDPSSTSAGKMPSHLLGHRALMESNPPLQS